MKLNVRHNKNVTRTNTKKKSGNEGPHQAGLSRSPLLAVTAFPPLLLLLPVLYDCEICQCYVTLKPDSAVFERFLKAALFCWGY